MSRLTVAEQAKAHCTTLDSIEYDTHVKQFILDSFKDHEFSININRPRKCHYEACEVRSLQIGKEWEVGVFATREIRKKGTLLFPVGGKAFLFDDVVTEDWHECLDIVFEQVLLDTSGGDKRNFTQYINHDCDANCEWVLINYCQMPMLWVRTKKSISIDEQLTCAYSETLWENEKEMVVKYFGKSGCFCDWSKCMGKVIRKRRRKRIAKKAWSASVNKRKEKKKLTKSRKKKRFDPKTGRWVKKRRSKRLNTVN